MTWTADKYEDAGGGITIRAEDGGPVCRVPSGSAWYGPQQSGAQQSGARTTEQRDRHVYMILAAPALLSICEELLESAAYWSEYDVPLGIVDRLREAVRDAKGESMEGEAND